MTGLRRTLRDRRGFTLVELVVVLVILGITASFAVPALTGYIDTSKEKKAVSEAQACVMAATDLGAAQYADEQKKAVEAKFGGSATLGNLGGWITLLQSTDAPAVTSGEVALTEGLGQYYLHTTSQPSGNMPMTKMYEIVPDILSRADVSGSVEELTFNTEGVLHYLVYKNADGIIVVYTNDSSTTTVKSDDNNVVTVPTPKATDAPTDQPDEEKSYTGTDKENKVHKN